jgi:hypothetical protein
MTNEKQKEAQQRAQDESDAWEAYQEAKAHSKGKKMKFQ